MGSGLRMAASSIPKVLFIGNGVLRLAGGGNWSDLIHEIETAPHNDRILAKVPFAMQPEAVCGVDVEEVQRKTAAAIKDAKDDSRNTLRRLLSLPFDAILTTNYTYEIERILTGEEWTERARRKAFVALDGNSRVRHNTFVCSMISRPDGKTIPVFHIHGERMRKHSLILSYYSYANSVSRLIYLNKKRGNEYQEKQANGESFDVLSWLDYFLLGEVYAVGFGFDPSEFDIWWAIERKARENARHGIIHALLTEEHLEEKPQKVLFEAMQVDLHNFTPDHGYQAAYEEIIEYLRKEVKGNE